MKDQSILFDMERDINQCLEEIRPRIVKYLRSKGAPEDEADDAAQEACLEIFNGRARFAAQLGDVGTNIGLFLRIGMHQWLRALRREKRARLGQEKIAEIERRRSAEGLIEVEQIRLFELPHVTRLTATQHRYLTMLLHDEMSISEVAKSVGTSVRAVNRVVQRARISLRPDEDSQ